MYIVFSIRQTVAFSVFSLLNLVTVSTSISDVVTPDFLQSTSPLWKSISVGTDCILYLADSFSSLSTSTAITSAQLPIFFFTSSRIGFMVLQGPHHSAKKSTRTNLSESIKVSYLLMMLLFCSPTGRFSDDTCFGQKFDNVFIIA